MTALEMFFPVLLFIIACQQEISMDAGLFSLFFAGGRSFLYSVLSIAFRGKQQKSGKTNGT